MIIDKPNNGVGGESKCSYYALGFCAASVDGYCVGGTSEGKCHG